MRRPFLFLEDFYSVFFRFSGGNLQALAEKPDGTRLLGCAAFCFISCFLKKEWISLKSIKTADCCCLIAKIKMWGQEDLVADALLLSFADIF